MTNREYSPDEWRQRAETYCARAEHCASEVRRKLSSWGADTDEAEAIVAHLYRENYLNDARYCRAYTHDQLLYRQWGKVKIRAMLTMLRLPEECISEAIAGIEEEEYMRILRRVADKKKSATREQRIRFLLQRGFEYEDIRSLTENK